MYKAADYIIYHGILFSAYHISAPVSYYRTAHMSIIIPDATTSITAGTLLSSPVCSAMPSSAFTAACTDASGIDLGIGLVGGKGHFGIAISDGHYVVRMSSGCIGVRLSESHT